MPHRLALGAWTTLNVLVSVGLGLGWWLARTPSPTVQPAPMAAVATLPADEMVLQPPQGSQPLRVEFPTVMVDSDYFPRDADAGLLQLTPALPGRLEWIGPRFLQFRPDGPYPSATRVQALLDPEAMSVDGRRIGSHALTFIPQPLELTWVNLMDADEGFQEQGHTLHLQLTMPVDAEPLRKALSVDGGWEIWEILPASDLGNAWSIRIRPTATAQRKAFSLTLHAGLQPRRGSEALAEDIVREIRIEEDAQLASIELDNEGIHLKCSAQLAFPEAGLLTITPERPFQIERNWSGLFLRCELQPGELVRIQAPAGFPGRGRYRIGEAIDDVLRVTTPRPKLTFPQSGMVLSRLALPLIEVESLGVEQMRVGLRRVYDNNQVQFLRQRWGVPDAVCTPWRIRDQAIIGDQQRSNTGSIDLRQVWGESTLPSGWYEVEISDANPDWRRRASNQRKLLQITDLAATVRCLGGEVAVSVSHLADGNPVAQAEVRVLSPTNQLLVSGHTADDGLLRLTHATLAEDQTPHTVIVSSGDDALAIDLQRFRLDLVGNDLGGESDPAHDLQGWAWCERGIARPGEALRASAVVRTIAGRAPLGQHLSFRLLDPGGRRAATFDQACPADGLLAVEHIPKGAVPQGTWRWELWTIGPDEEVLARAWQRVEPFVPDRIVATASIEPQVAPGVINADQPWHITATVHLTTGEAAADTAVDCAWRLQPSAWRPPGSDDFSFARQYDPRESITWGVVAQQRLTTQADGRAVWSGLRSKTQAQQIVNVLADGRAHDPGGRTLPIAAQAVLARAHLLGVRARLEQEQIFVATRWCDAMGAGVAAAQPITLTLERRRYRWDLAKVDGRMRWQSSIDRDVVTTAEVLAGAGAIFAIPPAIPDTWFTVVAHIGDSTVAESSPGNGPPPPPDRLQCRAIGSALPGGVATIEITAPIAGTALITCEGSTITHAERRAIPAGTSTITVPVPAEWTRPNLHVVVVLTQAQRSAGERAPWLGAAADVTITPPLPVLPVTITVAANATPEVPLPITISAPGARRALVVAVDEAVLARTSHPVPNPYARFQNHRALSGSGATSLASLLERPRWPLAPGGDGDEGDDLLMALANRGADLDHLGACAHWALIDLDANGTGNTRFDCSDFEGRLRVIAIAATSTTCGAARADCLVRAPLGVRVSVPRVLAPGDQCEAVVLISSRANAGTCRITLEDTSGFTCQAPTELPNLAVESTTTLRIGLIAGEANPQAQLAIRAVLTAADGSSVTRIVQTRLPIRPAARYAEQRRLVSVNGATTWKPDGTWTGPVQVDVRVARDERDALRPALDTLIAYPHGCGEQVSSQVLVLAACANVVATDDHGDGAARARGILPHGVAHLLRLSTRDGFAMWPQQREADLTITPHIVRALLAAETSGIDLDPRQRREWLDDLESILRRERRLLLRCQAVAALAEGGRRVGAWIELLATPTPDREACAWLALAAVRNGDRDRAEALLVASEQAVTTPDSTDLPRSSRRCDAALLHAWSLVDPSERRTRVLADRLLDDLSRPERLTTYDLAHMLPAMAAWFATQPRQDATIPVTLSGVTSDAFAGESQTLAPGAIASGVITAAGLTCTAEQATRVIVSVQGWRSDPGLTTPGLTLTRRWQRCDTGQRVEQWERGQCYQVELLITSDRPLPTLVLTDLLPAGCESETWSGLLPAGELAERTITPTITQTHDDRVVLVLDGLQVGTTRVTHVVRATTAGSFHLGPPSFEAFSDSELAAVGSAQVVDIRE